MTRLRKLLVFTAIAVLVLAYGAWAGYVRFGCEHVQNNTLVGRTEAQVRQSYGHPDTDEQGYQSLAMYVPPSLPPGPVRTLIYHPLGILHPEGGTLWVWVTDRNGEWVCFESCWFADGVRF